MIIYEDLMGKNPKKLLQNWKRSDKSESKDTIKILLNIGKESDPKLYDILEKTIQMNKHTGLHIEQFVLRTS
jgi:hypothetical protein